MFLLGRTKDKNKAQISSASTKGYSAIDFRDGSRARATNSFQNQQLRGCANIIGNALYDGTFSNRNVRLIQVFLFIYVILLLLYTRNLIYLEDRSTLVPGGTIPWLWYRLFLQQSETARFENLGELDKNMHNSLITLGSGGRRKRLFMPLLLYFTRLHTYALYTDFFIRRVWQIQRVMYKGVYDKRSFSDQRLYGTHWKKIVEREIERTQFVLYVQRLHMRALRHADAICIETLHTLRYLAITIPALQTIWKGDDYCKWEGIRCRNYHIDLNDLVDETLPLVQTYVAGSEERLRRIIATSSVGQKHSSRNITRQLLSPYTPSYWLEYTFSMDADTPPGQIIFPRQKDTKSQKDFWDEHNYAFYTNLRASLKPPQLYLGVMEGTDTDMGHLTNELVRYYEHIGFRVVPMTKKAMTIPITIATVDLTGMNLRGHIPQTKLVKTPMQTQPHDFMNSTDDLEVINNHQLPYFLTPPTKRHDVLFLSMDEVDGYAPRFNISSPREDAYWPLGSRGNSGNANYWTPFISVNRSNSTTRKSYKEDLTSMLHEVLARLEKVGTQTKHHDLAMYFYDVSLVARFPAEGTKKQFEKELADFEEMLTKADINLSFVQSMRFTVNNVVPPRSSITNDAFGARMFSSDGQRIIFNDSLMNSDSSRVATVDGQQFDGTIVFGEIELRLVGIDKLILRDNMFLQESLPLSWIRMPMLRVIDCSGTLIDTRMASLAIFDREGLDLEEMLKLLNQDNGLSPITKEKFIKESSILHLDDLIWRIKTQRKDSIPTRSSRVLTIPPPLYPLESPLDMLFDLNSK